MKSKEKIPVYDICSLSDNQVPASEFLMERFGSYLKRHPASLHLPHRHQFYHLVLFTKGSGYHTIDFTRFKVKPFDIYFMVPGQVHGWQFASEADGYIINFSVNIFRSFLLNPDYLDRFSFFQGTSENSVCQIPAESRNELLELFEKILKESKTAAGMDRIRLWLLQVFMLVDQTGQTGKKKSNPVAHPQLLKNFSRLIDQHYLSLKLPKQYADLLYITPNHLNALAQDQLGKTAGALIRDRVLLEAKRLLTNADMTIGEIAYALNFQDNSYFNRFFKKYETITPEEFRKKFITV